MQDGDRGAQVPVCSCTYVVLSDTEIEQLKKAVESLGVANEEKVGHDYKGTGRYDLLKKNFSAKDIIIKGLSFEMYLFRQSGSHR